MRATHKKSSLRYIPSDMSSVANGQVMNKQRENTIHALVSSVATDSGTCSIMRVLKKTATVSASAFGSISVKCKGPRLA